jgi:predicted RND superfamily exporter protein
MERSTPELDFAELAAPDGSLRAQVFLEDLDLDSVAFLRDVVRANGQGTGVYPAGELIAYADFAEAVPRALLRSLVLCLLLVGTLLALVVRARGGTPIAPVLAAAGWGPALVLVMMAAFAVPVNFLTCVFASVLVGLTGDNAVQYLCAAAPGGGDVGLAEGAAQRGAASIQIALIMSLCALVFLGSAFVASRRLGLLLGLGLLASLVGDLWVLRSLLSPGRRS